MADRFYRSRRKGRGELLFEDNERAVMPDLVNDRRDSAIGLQLALRRHKRDVPAAVDQVDAKHHRQNDDEHEGQDNDALRVKTQPAHVHASTIRSTSSEIKGDPSQTGASHGVLGSLLREWPIQ